MRVLLFPGLDGTGILFKDLLSYIPANFNAEVISLDNFKETSTTDIAQSVIEQHSSEQFILVAESYSGKLAHKIAAIAPQKVLHIIYIASFISRPSLLSTLAPFIPVSLLHNNLVTNKLLYWLGFSSIGDMNIVNDVFYSLKQANKRKLRERLKSVSTYKAVASEINIPITYIKPTKDYLVSNGATNHLLSQYKNNKIIELIGGHFIAQTHPKKCAKIITDTYSKYSCANTAIITLS